MTPIVCKYFHKALQVHISSVGVTEGAAVYLENLGVSELSRSHKPGDSSDV